jgi:hypothetical protein
VVAIAAREPYGADMATAGDWVLLSYRLPREPSTVRVGVWRKLRRLGVVQVLDGLVAMPADARTREQLEWIADEVLSANGEANVWLARPASAAQERSFAKRMADAVAEDYAAVTQEADEALGLDDVLRARALRRLRGALGRIRQRDFFPPAERETAQRAVEALAASVATAPDPAARS